MYWCADVCGAARVRRFPDDIPDDGDMDRVVVDVPLNNGEKRRDTHVPRVSETRSRNSGSLRSAFFGGASLALVLVLVQTQQTLLFL